MSTEAVSAPALLRLLECMQSYPATGCVKVSQQAAKIGSARTTLTRRTRSSRIHGDQEGYA
jgi:hypothetical protein